ncbi:IS66 family transposase [Nguyenibacter vanlangensis]|uniref:IS66 family transposase n=1 Tax=Nguyenibacter vanlangensis TaxID=1216886 RepID=A0ABZ3D9I9_9PROT
MSDPTTDPAEELAALRAELAATREALARAEDKCTALQLQIERTREQLALMRRQKYGQKSERHQKEMDQLELVLDEFEETLAEASAERAAREREKGETSTPRRKAIRRPLPEHLPREVIELAPAVVCDCRRCDPERLVRIGEDVTEVLEKITAPLKVLRYVRPRVACRSCEKIFQAPVPDLPIEKGRASASLIASVIVAKYWDGLPLHRQSAILARDGVEIDRSTLADWIGHGAWWLEPLRDRIQAYVMNRDVLWTDDTPIKVLAPGRGKTKEARIWCYGHDPATWGSNEPPAMLYCYSADRKGERPRTHLEHYAGWLHSDAYVGYEKLFGNKGGKPSPIRPVACMAHARRYFFDVYATQPAPWPKRLWPGSVCSMTSNVRSEDCRRNSAWPSGRPGQFPS